jgi:hypothetical protein
MLLLGGPPQVANMLRAKVIFRCLPCRRDRVDQGRSFRLGASGGAPHVEPLKKNAPALSFFALEHLMLAFVCDHYDADRRRCLAAVMNDR